LIVANSRPARGCGDPSPVTHRSSQAVLKTQMPLWLVSGQVVTISSGSGAGHPVAARQRGQDRENPPKDGEPSRLSRVAKPSARCLQCIEPIPATTEAPSVAVDGPREGEPTIPLTRMDDGKDLSGDTIDLVQIATTVHDMEDVIHHDRGLDCRS